MCKPDMHIAPSELPSHPTFQSWEDLLTWLASAHPSIVMKFSGAFSELPQDERLSALSGAQKEEAIVAYILPWAKEVFSIFGSDRIIWGSDWPVCKLGYEKIFLDTVGKSDVSAWEVWRRLSTRLLE